MQARPVHHRHVVGQPWISLLHHPPGRAVPREGRLLGFGYTGRRRPSLIAPYVPTMPEAGYPDWKLFGMQGLWTTAGVPRERIEIHAARHRTPP